MKFSSLHLPMLSKHEKIELDHIQQTYEEFKRTNSLSTKRYLKRTINNVVFSYDIISIHFFENELYYTFNINQLSRYTPVTPLPKIHLNVLYQCGVIMIYIFLLIVFSTCLS